MKKKAPHTFKDNFWSKRRIEKELTIAEIAELLGMSDSAIGTYFSGQVMPKDTVIADLCDLLEVEPLEGLREFTNAHKKWDAEHKKSLKYSAKKQKLGTKHTKNDATEINTVEDAIKALYGVLSCEEFTLVYDCLKGDSAVEFNLPAMLYHKIDDYETYANIIRKIGNIQEKKDAGVE